MRVIQGMTIVAMVVLVACGKKPEPSQAQAGEAAGKMAAMPMAMQGMTMMPLMRAHLDSLGAMQPTGMAEVMPAHQDLASRMMDAMGADMRGMGMQPDSAWASLSDSLRQDLADLPGLSDGALKTRMQAHIARMQRMMVMHEGMMKM